MTVCIFERIDITGGARGKFIELIRGDWARYAEARHGVRLSGCWATIGSTAAWPEASLLWEMDDWAHFAAAQAAQNPLEDRDPVLNEMWRQALAWRSGGHNALLVPTAFTPPRPSTLPGTGAPVVLYEEVRALPGKLEAYHAALAAHRVPALRARGVELFGAYTHALRPNAGVNLWAFASWEACAALPEDDLQLPGGDGWTAKCAELLADSAGWLLATPPARVLRT